MIKVPVPVDPAMVSDDRVAEAKARLREAGVEYCFAAWVDIHGRPKAKIVGLGPAPRPFRVNHRLLRTRRGGTGRSADVLVREERDAGD